MKLSYIFIFVLCYQPAASSSLIKPYSEYKSSHQNTVTPLLRDSFEIWQPRKYSIDPMYTQICLDCTQRSTINCEKKLHTFCKQPGKNCDSFPILTLDCLNNHYCDLKSECTSMWANSKCDYKSKKCICEDFHTPNFHRQTCESQIYYPTQTPTKRTTTRIVTYEQKCYRTSECNAANSWTGLWCQSRQCTCPPNSRPDHYYKRCVQIYISNNSSGQKNYVIGLGISSMLILVCVSVCVCVSRSRRTALRNHDSRPIGVSNTNSNLELLGELADLPPEYSDIYMIMPHGHDRHCVPQHKLPTYEEAVQRPEWNSQPLFVVEAHSSEEELNPTSTTGTNDGQPEINDYSIESSESGGHINHGYVSITSFTE